MKTWEYTVVVGHSTHIVTALNKLGADGWEAVGAVSSDSGCIHEVLLKREVSN